MFKLMQNRLFRIVGSLLILYLAVFHERHDPDSIGSFVQSGALKSQISEAKKQGKFIAKNVHLARQKDKTNGEDELLSANNNIKLSKKTIKSGTGTEVLECGDEAQIKYEIYDNNRKLIQSSSKKIIASKGTSQIISYIALGMKNDEVRVSRIPSNFQSSDRELIESMKFTLNSLKYKVTLVAITNKKSSSCK
jgi:hypothetical protein